MKNKRMKVFLFLLGPLPPSRIDDVKCYCRCQNLKDFTVGSTSSGSAFVIAPNLGAKILSEYFTGNAPPLYILDPLL